MAPRTFLVDGSALAYRSFFARGPAPAYAYAASLLSLVEREQPDYALIALDTPKPTFRHEAFPAYKANRPKAPSELIELLPLFERIALCLGFPAYALPGWEADDVIGALTRRATDAGHQVFIVSGDKDFMQLVGDQVSLYNAAKPGEAPVIKDDVHVRHKFHCRPDQVVDVLALMGDSSDNVPGVPRVGEKTALGLIERFESLDDIYEHLERVQPASLRARLEEGRDLAYLSRELVTIRTDCPVDLDLEALRYDGPDVDRSREVFVELDYPSLIERLGGAPASPSERVARVVTTRPDYEAFLQQLAAARHFAFDLETTSLTALEAEIVGLAFCFQEGEAWYLPANLPEPMFGPGDRGRTARERSQSSDEGPGVFDTCEQSTEGLGIAGDPLRPPEGSDLHRFLEDLRPVLEDPRTSLEGQNIKYDLLVLGRYGIRPARVVFDTMLASYCLEAHQSQHNLDFLALKHLGLTKIPTTDLIGKGARQISMWDVPVARCGEYACEDAEVTFRLARLFEQRLAGTEVEPVFRDIEMPLLRVLETMERHGVLVDTGRLAQLSVRLAARLDELTTSIHELAGEAFNIASPKQLAAILFEKLRVHEQLGVKRIRRTKSGYSTDASVLESLAGHPLPARILEHRKLAKLKGTYVDALPGLAHPGTGRIHTSFKQAVAATGRLASADPNLQNIPIRSEEGRRIREAFVAEEGHVLLSADYSQVELRLMAHLSGDEALIQTFREGVDVHRRTAALVFGVTEQDVDAELRSRAKAINFGILYGMGAQRLARETGLSNREAAAFIDQYFDTFPGVRRWLNDTRAQAEQLGFVSTLTGRQRRIENLDGANPRLAASAANMAVNTPIQGTAADLIKIAMVSIQDRLETDRRQTRMILQVHDELLFEVPTLEFEEVTPMIVATMEGAMDLDVPLVVDTGSGPNWSEAH